MARARRRKCKFAFAAHHGIGDASSNSQLAVAENLPAAWNLTAGTKQGEFQKMQFGGDSLSFGLQHWL